MYKFSFVVILLFLASCAFYQKNYVSEIVVKGTNYRGPIYDEGVFYVNADPSIRMRMGCYHSTQLGETMGPAVPLPIFSEAKPHNSMASHQFSLTLSHKQKDKIDLSTLKINVEIAGMFHNLSFVRMDTPPYSYSNEYKYTADLRCGEIEEGVLRIELGSDKVREYGIQFQEGIDREVAHHSSFET